MKEESEVRIKIEKETIYIVERETGYSRERQVIVERETGYSRERDRL